MDVRAMTIARPNRAVSADHRARRRPVVVFAVAMLIVAGCAADPADEAPDDVSSASTPSVIDLLPTESTSAVPSVAPTPVATSDPTTGADLAGEPVDFFFGDGDQLGVVGVASDDVLNIRSGPGVERRIVARAEPLAEDVVATGRARSLTRSIWVEVTVGDVTGWANSAFLAYLGQTTDATAAIVDQLGGRPTAETMVDLGREVAQSQASTEPASDIVVVQRPSDADVPDIVYDVVGLGDDATLGLRLRVFGEPDPSGEAFSLRTVEQTLLCDRGVSAEGLCS